MATATNETQCVTCGKEKSAYKCDGCSQSFCFNHLAEHHQQLDKQFDELENQRNLFRQTINPHNHPLVQQINQWELDSISRIRATADEARELLFKHVNGYIEEIEIKLMKLTEEIKEIREENDLNENNLNKLKVKLKKLQDEFNKPSNVQIQEKSSSFINQISIIISSDQTKQDSSSSIDTNSTIIPLQQLNISSILINAKQIQNGITVAGGNGQGSGLNQLANPYGIYVDDNQTIYVADYDNHRIIEWKNGAATGQVVAGGKGQGNRNNQLSIPWNVIVDKENDSLIISDYGNSRVVRWPRRNGTSGQTLISNVACRDLAMDNNGYLYVSDINKHEVRRWKIGETDGTLVAGGNGQGDRLDQLNTPNYIFVDKDESVYVSDYCNHRVMKWLKDAREGILVAGGQGDENSLRQLLSSMGITVDQLGTIYIADYFNHRVMRWLKGAKEGSVVVGGNGLGGQENQLNYPSDLSFDGQNNLYVVDCHNHRVQKFNIIS